MGSVLVHNTVRKIREKLLMSRAELARNAGISPLTVDRIEKRQYALKTSDYKLTRVGLIY
jgi:DNA-binding XRE family transcriptional regulator